MTSVQTVLLFAALLPQGGAQDPLPKGEAIMDRYVAVTGGREAYEKRRTEVRTITMEVKGKDLRFAVTVYRAQPNKGYSISDIPGMGKVEEGTDGEVAWGLTSARGAVIKQGTERDMALYGAVMNVDVRWREFFPTAETAGTENIDGRTCYKLLLTATDGNQHTRYYEKETGFLAKVVLKVTTPQGQFPVELLLYDYRPAGGVVQSHRSVKVLPGQEIESKLEKLETNVEIDPSRFALPEAVKALIEKQKAGKPESQR